MELPACRSWGRSAVDKPAHQCCGRAICRSPPHVSEAGCRKDEFYYEIDCFRDFGVNVTAVNESRRCKSGPDRSAGSTWCPLSPGIRQMGRRDASNTSVSQTRSKSRKLSCLAIALHFKSNLNTLNRFQYQLGPSRSPDPTICNRQAKPGDTPRVPIIQCV